MTRLTKAQKDALRWLLDHNGDGGFDKHNVLVAGGEKAPIMRSTWNALAVNELVEFYMNKRRLRLTQAGTTIAENHTTASQGRSDPEDDDD